MDGWEANRMRGMTVRAGLLAIAAAAWLAAAPGAQAATVTTDCAGLQNALNNASSGDTIVLTRALRWHGLQSRQRLPAVLHDPGSAWLRCRV